LHEAVYRFCVSSRLSAQQINSSIANVIHGSNHIAVTGEMCAKEGGLTAFTTVTVRENDEWEGARTRSGVHHCVLSVFTRPEEEIEARHFFRIEVLTIMGARRGVPDVDRHRAITALI
jgi:hypothetical protein